MTSTERQLGVRLPEPYWSGFAAEGEVVLAGPERGDEIRLLAVTELTAMNEAAELPNRLPGLLIIGTDGSRELLAADTRTTPAPIVLVDITFSGWDDAIFQARNLEEFLRDYPSTGLRWT